MCPGNGHAGYVGTRAVSEENPASHLTNADNKEDSICAGVGSHAVRVSDRRIWVFCALGAGSCARCVYEERDPILEVLLTCRVYYRDFQPVAADTEIGR